MSEIKTRTSTGLSDSDGNEIFVGDIVRNFTDYNLEVHGSWVDYEIKQQGLTPILSYYRSEKGQVLPRGYTGQVLADAYDSKNFLFINDTLGLRPSDMNLKRQDSREKKL